MGITWRFKMVLLSTLAALVIIVHSAEEEYENQHRRGLRPRPLDTGTRRYEQPWRTLETEPIMQDSTSRAELEDISSEEPPRRRRPGRKRKHRPQPLSIEEDSSERYAEDNIRPQFDDLSNERQTSERPKRRRKKIERRLKWTDSLEEDRPIRRRGQRRKRPSKDTWPELSEFSGYRPNQAPQYADEVTTDQAMTINENTYDDAFGNSQRNTQKRPDVIVESREEIEIDNTQQSKNDDKHQKVYNNQAESIYRALEREDGFRINTPVKEKTSLSEFSLEDLPTVVETKPSDHYKESVKAQNSGPIDPLTLKDILKKSNGTSLSEILQQHNLSLADLLRGKELALSILKSESNIITQAPILKQPEEIVVKEPIQSNSEENDTSEEKVLVNSETKFVTEPITDIPTTTFITQSEEEITTVDVKEITTTENPKAETTSKPSIMQRFPIRRKQRIRPVINNNYKSQLNRDMLALTAKKYFYNNRRRNVTKSQQWRDVIPLMKNVTEIVSEKPKIMIETTTVEVETTTTFEENNNSDIALQENSLKNDTDNDFIITEASQNVNVSNKVNEQEKPVSTETGKLKSIPTIPQVENASGLRRQAFNNILKKKRRKLKYSTTEPPPQDDFMKNLFGIPNLVSSSEFIERTQGPKIGLDDVTILEDITTTEISSNYENKPSNLETKPKAHENKHRKNRFSTRPPTIYINRQTLVPSSTEESAKIEIEEILNDTWANARLSKILMERNMTLSELVEHRERGSSHVHLADIFHNASKEPNPPEPFLSKSAIEPISKEIYPLRALLDAHDTTTRATTTEPVQDDYIHIPMKMNFGNNVNENAENMGIMSLFNNIKSETKNDTNPILKDSQGTPYSTSVIVVNATDDQSETETVRESRVMHSINENPDDVVGWSEIFSLMRRNYENKTKELSGTYLDGLIPAETLQKPSSDEDLDGDGLIVLEDLQRLNELSNKISSTAEVDINAKRSESPKSLPGIIDKPSNQNQTINTKSITLAVASIVGLALVLFLLTYIGYRWRQHRIMGKSNFPDERIPTPVFENRKGHKHNSSTRSISPMLSSNIYTLSTLDSQNGKESPDYMWDTLRKPFQ